ncbi:hypothetical protein AO385_1955 [Moraxella catarrhalis]|uniref:Uncharacterized protein n=1 Tax=Moraxella catarrhalis TaxID=480 RepID=A0A198V0T3_MORCA|nr:hypothetical protein AO384_1894 [Moraxella catarrhalis]OAU95531.1 hypothetical protein AO385_1955 [Moraxella catarrhalis]OAU96859.1 hypothetical protein AO383_1376 [Moraxella catarrhalis]OAV02122.1 hypothetical protein AO382_0488 [Moraxella catarrhalis]
MRQVLIFEFIILAQNPSKKSSTNSVSQSTKKIFICIL